jgi:hypothetical protein
MNTSGRTRRTRDPREIEAELDRTRIQMSNTLDELQRKLSPGELFDQTLSYVRSNGGGEFASTLRLTVARNPLPVALVGLGLAWLMISGRSGSARSEYDAPAQDYGIGAEGTMSSELEADARGESSSSMPSDEVAEGMDEGSPTSPRAATMSGGASHASGPSDELAEGLDESSPTSRRSGPAMQEGGSSVTGPSDEVAKGMDETSPTDHRTAYTTSGTRSETSDKASAQEQPR